ncbi:MAG: hypothetical protein QM772_18455 [Ottowia sp.]|uniref:hypothetical protein n=1 Tax=Ottowia sp. TaxID=1898956 RepID=UPI0039E3366F
MADADFDDRPVDVHSPEVPEGIRQAVLARMRPGDVLWRCPSKSAPRGPLAAFGFGRRGVVIEWWLVAADGDLVEAYWEE